MSVRVQAARVLAAVLKREASLAATLPPALERTLEKDRPLLQQLCYGSCRYLPALERLAGLLLNKPLKAKDQDIQALILIGLFQLLHTRIPAHAAISETVQATVKLKKPWAKGLINGTLRAFQRQPQLLQQLQQQAEYRFAHPRWLIERLQQAWPQDWPQVLEQNNQQGPMSLRVNLLQGSREAYCQQLRDLHIDHQPNRYSACGITLDSALDVDKLPGFRQGRVSVQDEAAQLAAGLLDLKPAQRVLDACAAPGGKTGHILETEPALQHCLAIDISEERLDRVRDNLQRIQLQCQLQVADAARSDWWDGTPFERILLDAPCSATGVIRRNPDIKHLRRNTDIDNLAALQGKILANLWTMLSPGGRLVYATCSVLPDENERVILDFLDSHKDATEITIQADWGVARPAGRQLFPQPRGHDGFYYAVLEKLCGT